MSEAPSALGRRVIVTGLAGSGKSTFSLALAAKTGLPVIHLDLHFWKPGWVAPSETEWREKQCGVLAGNAWIADGNYHETLDLRLERADTVVFLDPPWWLCARRAFLRGFRMPSELPEGCDYSAWLRLRDEWRLAVRIWRKRRSEPEREHEIISQHGQQPADDDRLRIHNALADAYAALGDYRQARGHASHELPLRIHLQGADHPSTLTTRQQLATYTGRAGDRARARDLFAALLPVRERVLGPEHPDSLATRLQLATYTGETGDRARARDLFAALLPIRERVLGPEHPDSLATRRGLAYWKRQADDAAG